MELRFVGLLCGCGGGVAVLLALAALLKLSAFVASRLIQPTRQESQRGWSDWDWDEWDDEYEPGPRKSKPAIPVPGLVKGAAIVLLTALVGVLGFILLGFFAEEAMGLRMRRDETQLAVVIVELPFVALTLTVLMLAMLPTTFRRAATVSAVFFVLFLAFTAVVGAAIFMINFIFD